MKKLNSKELFSVSGGSYDEYEIYETYDTGVINVPCTYIVDGNTFSAYTAAACVALAEIILNRHNCYCRTVSEDVWGNQKFGEKKLVARDVTLDQCQSLCGSTGRILALWS